MLNKKILSLAILGVLSTGALAETTAVLNTQTARITDQAIHADYKTYEAVQGRIKALNDKGRKVSDYHLAKAQCWLDVSFHEYTRNDRSAFPQEALTESEKLVYGMENNQVLGFDTPLVNNADKLRPDLWERANWLHEQRGFGCVAQKVSCAEVELVHAGNEHKQQGWRHAKPYVQIAEDLVAEASAGLEACEQKVAAQPVVVPEVKPVQLLANVLFNFDKFDVPNIRPLTKERLDNLVSKVTSGYAKVEVIHIVGHADRLNSTGKTDYNVKLALKRVNTIKAYLVNNGIDPQLIKTDAKADTQQIEACHGKYKSQAELQECLLPNRRVEVELLGTH